MSTVHYKMTLNNIKKIHKSCIIKKSVFLKWNYNCVIIMLVLICTNMYINLITHFVM